ncbi:uncharacterized protein LOC142827113 isoform X2 [Pelodiscus sinensis]|uniref:uncharacterized protein LOC142827113 isoform X2 n=1 Tax=Pelodiscus sinensis TaxID=13735 RepID=UPI003F6B3AFE
MFVCPAGVIDRNVHISAKTSCSENITPLLAVPLKNDFKPRKRRQQFWRRSQLGRRKLWCRRPKVMEQQQGREENQEVVQEQTPADKGQKVTVRVQPQQQNQAQMAPQVTVQVQQQDQGGVVPQVTVQVQPQGPGGTSLQVIVQVQQQDPGQMAPQVTVLVQPQQQSQGGTALQVTVEVQPQRGHDWQESQVTQTHHQGQDEEGSKAMQQQLNQDESEPQVVAKNEREPKELELEGKHGQDKEGAEAVEQQWDQRQLVEGPKVEQQLNQDESEPQVMTKDEREPIELELEGKQGQNKKGTEVIEQPQNQSQDEEGSKAVSLQKLSQEEEELKIVETEQQEGQRQDKQAMCKKQLREMPNYFVSIPITNDQILDKIEDVQELIFTKEPDLLRALIPVQTMHLTIIVAHLRTEEEVKKAILALEQSKTKVEAILQGKLFNMTFHGIGQFNNQVIYVKMSEDQQHIFNKIAEAVEGSFNDMGLDITGSKDFKPHLTFLKLSKAPALRRKGYRKISSDLYKEYEDSPFGTEIFSQIDLCAMHKKKQESGYYYCECSVNVDCSSAEENKEQTMNTQYLGERVTEVLPNDAAKVKIGDITAGCNCAPYVAKDDNPSENIAEASVTSKETEIDEKDVQPEAKDETFTADGEVCSQPAPDLLPVSPDALKGVDERQAKAKLSDGNLQRVEVTEVAFKELNIIT